MTGQLAGLAMISFTNSGCLLKSSVESEFPPTGRYAISPLFEFFFTFAMISGCFLRSTVTGLFIESVTVADCAYRLKQRIPADTVMMMCLINFFISFDLFIRTIRKVFTLMPLAK